MHPPCPNKKQNHLQNSLLRRTQFWVRKTFSKPASLKRASLVVQLNKISLHVVGLEKIVEFAQCCGMVEASLFDSAVWCNGIQLPRRGTSTMVLRLADDCSAMFRAQGVHAWPLLQGLQICGGYRRAGRPLWWWGVVHAWVLQSFWLLSHLRTMLGVWIWHPLLSWSFDIWFPRGGGCDTEEARTCEAWFQLTFRPQKWNLKAHMWYQLSPFPSSNVAICDAAPLRQHSPILRYSALLRYSVLCFNSSAQCNWHDIETMAE